MATARSVKSGGFIADVSLIIVVPELQALRGDCVIALNSENDTTCKPLINDGGDVFLQPLNLRYSVKPLGSARVIGVVREFTKRFR